MWSRHSPDGADEPFDEGVLIGCAGDDEDLADPHTLDSPHELIAVDCVTITEQVCRRRIVWERLDKLSGRPSGRGVVRDVDLEEFAAAVAKHHEDEQQAER
jgi:hypothetical protein